jgi:hypothetical protein
MMNNLPRFYRILLMGLLLGSALGVHAQEQARKPLLKEQKNIAVPIWKTLPQDKSGSASRERESPQPIPPLVPPTVMDKIPPRKSVI